MTSSTITSGQRPATSRLFIGGSWMLIGVERPTARFTGSQRMATSTSRSRKHLLEAEGSTALRALLFDHRWLAAKLKATSVNALLADFELLDLASDEPLRLLRDALRLSAHVLVHRPEELSSQLLGRLRGFSESHLSQLCAELETHDSTGSLPAVAEPDAAGGRARPHPRRPRRRGECSGVERGREAGGLRLQGQDVEGVGRGDREGTPHPRWAMATGCP